MRDCLGLVPSTLRAPFGRAKIASCYFCRTRTIGFKSSPPTNKKSHPVGIAPFIWRRMRDSNSRYLLGKLAFQASGFSHSPNPPPTLLVGNTSKGKAHRSKESLSNKKGLAESEAFFSEKFEQTLWRWSNNRSGSCSDQAGDCINDL
jgi:hypothetical protein